VVVIIRAANKKNGTRKKPTRSNLSAEMSRQKKNIRNMKNIRNIRNIKNMKIKLRKTTKSECVKAT